ncbi:MAG: hypothetical protein KAW92_09635 [Candidatus Cloacimonetes bacterium]|nr:hypothetical protein [Candidatus Cloacimonadota bacterium]
MKTKFKETCPCKNLVIRCVDEIDNKVKLKQYEVLVKDKSITGFLRIICPLCGWGYVVQ